MKTATKRKIIAWWCGSRGLPCFWCGRGFGADDMSATVDHFFPLARGGPNSQSNTVVAHRRCNNVRRHRIPSEMEMRKFVSVHGKTAIACLVQYAIYLQGQIAREKYQGRDLVRAAAVMAGPA